MTLAQLMIDRVAAGFTLRAPEVEAIPRFQWGIYFGDLAPLCPSRIVSIPVHQRNARLGSPLLAPFSRWARPGVAAVRWRSAGLRPLL